MGQWGNMGGAWAVQSQQGGGSGRASPPSWLELAAAQAPLGSDFLVSRPRPSQSGAGRDPISPLSAVLSAKGSKRPPGCWPSMLGPVLSLASRAVQYGE